MFCMIDKTNKIFKIYNKVGETDRVNAAKSGNSIVAFEINETPFYDIFFEKVELSEYVSKDTNNMYFQNWNKIRLEKAISYQKIDEFFSNILTEYILFYYPDEKQKSDMVDKEFYTYKLMTHGFSLENIYMIITEYIATQSINYPEEFSEEFTQLIKAHERISWVIDCKQELNKFKQKLKNNNDDAENNIFIQNILTVGIRFKNFPKHLKNVEGEFRYPEMRKIRYSR